MSDQRLRELERRFRATGAPEDEAPLLRERLRRSELSAARLELAAYLGHEAAALACSAEGIPLPTQIDVRLAHLPAAERAHWAKITQSAIDDPGRALVPGLPELRRPAWSVGLARFGGHVCLRAVVAGSSIIASCVGPRSQGMDEHLQLAASAVRGDPSAKAAAAAMPLHPDMGLSITSRLQNELCMTILAQDPDAPHRLAAALAELLSLRGQDREQAFQDAVRSALLPWVLKV